MQMFFNNKQENWGLWIYAVSFKDFELARICNWLQAITYFIGRFPCRHFVRKLWICCSFSEFPTSAIYIYTIKDTILKYLNEFHPPSVSITNLLCLAVHIILLKNVCRLQAHAWKLIVPVVTAYNPFFLFHDANVTKLSKMKYGLG